MGQTSRDFYIRVLGTIFFLALHRIGNPIIISSKVTDNKRLGYAAKSKLHSSVSANAKLLSFAENNALDLSLDKECLHRRANGRSRFYDVVL
jgi:hypothetical protein